MEFDQQQTTAAAVSGVKMPNPMYEATFKVPDVYYFPFDKEGLEKPWVENKERMEDYFNYGM